MFCVEDCAPVGVPPIGVPTIGVAPMFCVDAPIAVGAADDSRLFLYADAQSPQSTPPGPGPESALVLALPVVTFSDGDPVFLMFVRFWENAFVSEKSSGPVGLPFLMSFSARIAGFYQPRPVFNYGSVRGSTV
jgi:hypothetical protein